MFAIENQWKIYNVKLGLTLNLSQNGLKVIDVEDMTSIGRDIGKSNSNIDRIGDYVRTISINPRDIVLKIELLQTTAYRELLRWICIVCSASSSVLLIGSKLICSTDKGGIAGIVTDLTINRFASRLVASITIHCADPYIYKTSGDDSSLVKLSYFKHIELEVPTKPSGTTFGYTFPMDLDGSVPSRIDGSIYNTSDYTYWGKCVISSVLETEKEVVDGTTVYNREIEKSLTIAGVVNNAKNEIYSFKGQQSVGFSNMEGNINCDTIVDGVLTYPSVFYNGDLVDFYMYPRIPTYYANGFIRVMFITKYGSLINPSEDKATFVLNINAIQRWI